MRKLMWFTLGFAAAALLTGYLLPRAYYLPALVIASLLLAGALLCLLKWKRAKMAVALFLGATVFLCWQFVFDEAYLSTVRASDDQFRKIQVLVTEPCQESQYGFVTEGILQLEGKPYKVRLYLSSKVDAKLGDTVTGQFHLYSMLMDGSRSISYNRSNGVYLMASGGKSVSVTTPEDLPLLAYPAWMKGRITDLISQIFPADTLAFARALLLGDTELIDYELDTALKISGIRHVIAVSGLHVTILFSLLLLLTGRRRSLAALLGLPMLFLFAAVVGFTPSITRACIMHGMMVLAMLFDKEYDGPTALSFAVLVMLIANPMTVINVSFQLSVSCMAGIFLFSEPIKNWLMDKKRLGKYKQKKLTNWFASSVSISIGAAVITTPLSAIYFGTVSLVSILTNLLTLWIVTFLFYGIMAACLAGAVWMPLGKGIAWVISWGIRYVLGVARLLAAFPLAAVYTDSIYIAFWLVFCYALLGAFLWLRKKRPVVYSCCGAIGLCLALLLSWMEPMQDPCRVTVLDVGQGQCILLQSHGKNYLVDCGGDSDTASADAAARLLLSQGISRLDGLILTHYDRDHAGGAANLLSRVPTDVLYLPTSQDADDLSQDLLSYDSGQVLLVGSLQTISFEDTILTLVPSKNGLADNESGLCILFQQGNCDILITGDRSMDGEQELIQQLSLPKLEVLIVGHHGSKYSTCRELLEATQPETAIISVGANNSFGHPTEEVLQRLQEFGCIIYRTDVDGNVIYRG